MSSNQTPKEIVEAYLAAQMNLDFETANRFIDPNVKIVFTGGRKFERPEQCGAFNARRYKWVKKRMLRTDVVMGHDVSIVYNLGVLYGEWPDGTPFDGNRYIDRFEVRGERIIAMDVWNDSAELLLSRNGIDA